MVAPVQDETAAAAAARSWVDGHWAAPHSLDYWMRVGVEASIIDDRKAATGERNEGRRRKGFSLTCC